MFAEISFSCDDSHGNHVTQKLVYDYTIKVLLRHHGDRLYFFQVRGSDDDVVMDQVRRYIDDLPVLHLAKYGFNVVQGARLAASVHRVIDLAQYGHGHVDDRLMRDTEYPALKKQRLLLPFVAELTCVVSLD